MGTIQTMSNSYYRAMPGTELTINELLDRLPHAHIANQMRDEYREGTAYVEGLCDTCLEHTSCKSLDGNLTCDDCQPVTCEICGEELSELGGEA